MAPWKRKQGFYLGSSCGMGVQEKETKREMVISNIGEYIRDAISGKIRRKGDVASPSSGSGPSPLEKESGNRIERERVNH